MSHFFAYLSRMKYIKRWGLMRNTSPENILEHSAETAMIAHGLGIIARKVFGKELVPERVLAIALYHDIPEVITGDLATPIKYFNPQIKNAFQNIEQVAKDKLFSMVPAELHEEYRRLIFVEAEDEYILKLVKAADKISAYIKCIEEIKSGNKEFTEAEKTLKAEILKYEMPEVKYFMEKFMKSYFLSLDELN